MRKLALIGLILVAAAIAAILARETPPATQPSDFVADDPEARAIDTYLSRAVPFGYSGSALVARKGKTLLSKGYGLADDRRAIANTAATVHSIGSVTKQFTAAAIMKLWMQGKLQPEDQLRRFFPTAPADKQDITLHQLLSHTAGIVEYSGDDYAEATREQMVEVAFAAPLDFPPGTQYRYSNAGFSLLAAVVEIVSGRPYERFLHDELLAPAGLERTGYRIPDWNAATVARTYVGNTDNGTNLEKAYPSWNIIGNGEVLSTVGDLQRWHVALTGEKILSSAAKERMYTPNLSDYGYGWRIVDTPQGRKITHGGGSDQGSSCELRRFDDALIVTFANRDSKASIGDTVEKLLFGGEVALPPDGDPSGPAELSGRWVLPDGSAFTLSSKPDLRITAIGRGATEILGFAPGEPPPGLDALAERAESAFGALLAGDASKLTRELGDPARVERWRSVVAGAVEKLAPPIGVEVTAFRRSTREDVGELVAVLRLGNDKARRSFLLFFKQGKFAGLGGSEDDPPSSMRLLVRGPDRFIGHDLASGATAEIELRDHGKELVVAGRSIAPEP